jgi:hypothetical protein
LMSDSSLALITMASVSRLQFNAICPRRSVARLVSGARSPAGVGRLPFSLFRGKSSGSSGTIGSLKITAPSQSPSPSPMPEPASPT